MHLTAIEQRWRMPNLDKWAIGRWMLGFTKNVHPNLRATQPYIPNSNAAVNKDVIKPSSDIGNASKGFASSEVVQADRTIKDPPAPAAPTPSPKVDKA